MARALPGYPLPPEVSSQEKKDALGQVQLGTSAHVLNTRGVVVAREWSAYRVELQENRQATHEKNR